MKIDKITFKNNQAWVVLKSNEGDYLGTFHIVNLDFVNYIREINPEEMFFDKSLMNKKIEKIVNDIYSNNTSREQDAPPKDIREYMLGKGTMPGEEEK